MAIGVIDKDVYRGNKYRVTIEGTDYLAHEVGAAEQKMRKVELPDGTAASGGRDDHFEFPLLIPHHHEKEFKFFEDWWKSCQDPVLPSAYKTMTVTYINASGTKERAEERLGCWIVGRKTSDLSLDDGSEEMTVIEYTICCDHVD